MEVLAVVVSITGGGSLVLVAYLIYKVIDAQDGREAARVLAVSTASELAATKANLATANNRADSEKARADALDNVIADHADDGPVAGSFERLLQNWKAVRLGPADITGTRQLHPTTEAAAAGPDGLMRPGD